jgi:hypothetical protein
MLPGTLGEALQSQYVAYEQVSSWPHMRDTSCQRAACLACNECMSAFAAPAPASCIVIISSSVAYRLNHDKSLLPLRSCCWSSGWVWVGRLSVCVGDLPWRSLMNWYCNCSCNLLPQPPLGQRRTMILSGMYGSEVVQVISEYKEAGEGQGPQGQGAGRRVAWGMACAATLPAACSLPCWLHSTCWQRRYCMHACSVPSPHPCRLPCVLRPHLHSECITPTLMPGYLAATACMWLLDGTRPPGHMT